MVVSQRMWILGGVGAAVLMVGVTYAAGVGPARHHSDSLQAQTSAANDANDLLSIKISSLRKQAASMDELTAKLTSDRAALPSASSLPDFTRQLSAMAAAESVNITSIDASAPAATTGSAAATATAASPVGQLYEIPVTVGLTGTPARELDFLASLQSLKSRAVLVNNVSTAGPTMTISLKIFAAPQTTAQEAQLKKDLAATTK